jgi:hypothetical protein
VKPTPPTYRRKKVNGKMVRLEKCAALWLLPNGAIYGRVDEVRWRK